MGSNHQFTKQTLTNLAASLALLSGAALADTAMLTPAKCPASTPGVSLCGRVSDDLYVCVPEKPCGPNGDTNKPPEKAVMRLLRRLLM